MTNKWWFWVAIYGLGFFATMIFLVRTDRADEIMGNGANYDDPIDALAPCVFWPIALPCLLLGILFNLWIKLWEVLKREL